MYLRLLKSSKILSCIVGLKPDDCYLSCSFHSNLQISPRKFIDNIIYLFAIIDTSFYNDYSYDIPRISQFRLLLTFVQEIFF